MEKKELGYITRKIVLRVSEDKAKNEDYSWDVTKHDGDDICFICGKIIRSYNAEKPFKSVKRIHIFDGGRYATDLDFEEIGHPELEFDAGEMGWWAVGSDCYRRLKKELDASEK